MNNLYKFVAAFIVAGLIALSSLFSVSVSVAPKPLFEKLFFGETLAPEPGNLSSSNLEELVLPAEGVVLPVVWRDLGRQMTASGVINAAKFKDLYATRGGLTQEMEKMLAEAGNDRIKITKKNSQVWLNLLWALGLGNKNEILDKGEMQNPQFGGAGNFASTGGWTLASGGAMQHYSAHNFIALDSAQQALVDEVSRGIYRPCCGNSTHFPDCNHGMAMLGLLELMASQNVSEQEMYKNALAVNSYWFPDNYLTIAKFLSRQGISWDRVDSAEILGAKYSSAQGYARILKSVSPAPSSNPSCGA
ncbi:hypothetical protein D4R52_02835 [bacterium]|nr:MAG: hypothetical protein D4R52_02835 [bacterium]